MRNTKDWIKEKLNDYDENKEETLLKMFDTTNDIIEQFLKNPEHKNTKNLMENCLKHNKLFISIIEDFSCSDEAKNDSRISSGCEYFTSSMTYLPTKVIVYEVDNENKKAKTEHGWLDFSMLYKNREDCPQR